MADTAIKNEEEKQEYFDEPDVLEEKIEKLALWIKSSQHFIAFTGAGISTSTGIPDFRSGVNTVLETGPGAWEKAAQHLKNDKKYVRTSIQKAIPSPTHMAMVAMMDQGYLKFIVSQNVDGLHRKSGIPPENITELHGNTNVEICTKCNREFLRDFRVRTAQKVFEHKTGRFCDDPLCKGELKDTIINFKENLQEKDLDLGFGHSATADLCLAMGSSLRVTPAADMPLQTFEKGGKLVIVNLQKTPLDYAAALVIHAKCDEVMTKLCTKLDIQIPQFRLQRRFQVQLFGPKANQVLEVIGCDSNGSIYSLFTKITFKKKAQQGLSTTKEPFQVKITEADKVIGLELNFQGHYNEPNFLHEVDLEELRNSGGKMTYLMVFDPIKGNWEFCVPI